MKKAIAIIFLCSVIGVSGQQPEANNGKTAVLSRAAVEAAWQRVYGYDSAVTWKILDVGPASIPGMTRVVAATQNQPPVTAFVTQDGQFAIVGEMTPFGNDPYAVTRKKLASATGPTRGPNAPAIVIVEFADLQCPFCKATQPVLEKLLAEFPQIQYQFQQMPLDPAIHPWARKAAAYVECARVGNPDAYWKYIDSIYDNQGGIALATADDKLKELATASGFDAGKISACSAEPKTAEQVQKSYNFGLSVGVDALPTVFINGRKLTTAAYMPYDKLKELVQFEINHAGK